MSGVTEVTSDVSGAINRFDDPKGIFAAIVLGFAGTGVAMGLPLLVGSMAKSLSFSEEQLGTLSNIDHSGRYAALVPASQGAAQAIAPSVAGTLLAYNFGYSGVMMLCTSAAAVALLIYLYVYRNLLRIAPTIADAD